MVGGYRASLKAMHAWQINCLQPNCCLLLSLVVCGDEHRSDHTQISLGLFTIACGWWG